MKTTIFNQPGIEGNDFPRDSRLATYALILLESGQMNRHLLEMVFYVFPHGAGQKIAELFEKVQSTGHLNAQLAEALDMDDVVSAFATFLGSPDSGKSRKFRKMVAPLLKKAVRPDQPTYLGRVEQIRTKLNLNADEVNLLELGCCYRICKGLEKTVDSYDYTRKINLAAQLTSIPYSRLVALTSKKSRLAQNGLLELQNDNLSINFAVAHFLLGVSGKEFKSDAFSSMPCPELSFKHFGLRQIQNETLIRMIKAPGPVNILLHGKAGTGKTELSKALAIHCGMEAVFVDSGSDGDASDRKMALLTSVNIVPSNTIIVVDEVDVLLNTNHLFHETKVNKAWINHFLDNSQHKIIWITNNVSGMEESVRRRFDYNLHFKQLTWRQRETIWLTQLRKNRIKRFFRTPEIQRMAKRFPVSPGLIAYAVKIVAKCRSDNMEALEIHAMLNEVLARQMELTEGVTPGNKLNGINENYDVDAHNTDFDSKKLIQCLETWQKAESGFGINLLFWGWPGTGKTEFAKYLAERLGKEILVKRISDLQSMWVGETEKQIARAFHEAEDNDAILFLDEADSLFIDRQTAHRSWETSQTNEVLTQMENFKGILICCTNLLDHLDEAAMRRFAFKIKFLPLTPDGILRLYKQYFDSVKEPLPPDLESRLSSIRNLCPGDIKAVWQRAQFMGGSLRHGELVAELENEVCYKKGKSKIPIGF